jgi:hypothetical protein
MASSKDSILRGAGRNLCRLEVRQSFWAHGRSLSPNGWSNIVTVGSRLMWESIWPAESKRFRSEAAQRGTPMDRLDFSVLTAEEMAPRGIEGRIGELLKFGFKRILFLISPDQPDKQRTVSDRYATLIGKFA